MGRRALETFFILTLLLAGCTIQGGTREEDPLTDAEDTASDDDAPADTSVDDTHTPDTAPDEDTTPSEDTTPAEDTAPQDVADTSPDVPRDTIVTDDTMQPDVPVNPCDEPLRIAPDTVKSAGGELVWAYGQEFYIGALEWWLVIDGEVWVSTDYGLQEEPPSPNCGLPFRVPPLPPGDYPAAVVYGWPGSLEPVESPFTLHVEASTRHWEGGQSCALGEMCPAGQHCRLGLGFCVWDDCGFVSCDNGAEELVCDPLEGCKPPTPACESNADCAMIYSSCGCLAVHNSDPRITMSALQITACELDGCFDCDSNTCEQQALWPACDTNTGRCIEMPPI